MGNHDDEVKAARQAADENWRRNSGRDQAIFEQAVDIAAKAAKAAKGGQ